MRDRHRARRSEHQQHQARRQRAERPPPDTRHHAGQVTYLRGRCKLERAGLTLGTRPACASPGSRHRSVRTGGFARCILKLVYLPMRFLATTKISSLAPARIPRSKVLNRTPCPSTSCAGRPSGSRCPCSARAPGRRAALHAEDGHDRASRVGRADEPHDRERREQAQTALGRLAGRRGRRGGSGRGRRGRFRDRPDAHRALRDPRGCRWPGRPAARPGRRRGCRTCA